MTNRNIIGFLFCAFFCCSDDPSDHRRPYCSLVYGPQRPKLIEDKK